MGMVVPKVRKHLCADALLRSVQDVFGQLGLPGARTAAKPAPGFSPALKESTAEQSTSKTNTRFEGGSRIWPPASRTVVVSHLVRC